MHHTDWLDRTDYPFASHHFQSSAGRLHYVDEGSGEPVVMVHGNPTWSYLYRKQIKQLSPRYRCVAPDHIGFGLSDKPKDWSYLPSAHAANFAALIEELGLKKITLVVQDWGGPIGLSYAVDHPDNVARLVIINTWAWPVNRDPYYIGFSGFMGGPMGRFLIRRYNFFARSVLYQAFGDKSKLSPSAHQHYLRPLATPDERTGSHIFPKEIIGSTPWLAQIWDKIGVLSDKPVLIVWGMKDIAFREKELLHWQRTFPQAQTVRLATVGHFAQEEAPTELGDAVEIFLKETTF
jgi:haloalkane dehalogenase